MQVCVCCNAVLRLSTQCNAAPSFEHSCLVAVTVMGNEVQLMPSGLPASCALVPEGGDLALSAGSFLAS